MHSFHVFLLQMGSTSFQESIRPEVQWSESASTNTDLLIYTCFKWNFQVDKKASILLKKNKKH